MTFHFVDVPKVEIMLYDKATNIIEILMTHGLTGLTDSQWYPSMFSPAIGYFYPKFLAVQEPYWQEGLKGALGLKNTLHKDKIGQVKS